MIDELGETSPDDNDYNDREIVFNRLTKYVRQHYTHFLKKELEKNIFTWQKNPSMNGKTKRKLYSELPTNIDIYIQRTINKLEIKALRSCMATQIYQRAMMKIIQKVRHSTKKYHLDYHLNKILNDIDDCSLHNLKRRKEDESEIQSQCWDGINDDINEQTILNNLNVKHSTQKSIEGTPMDNNILSLTTHITYTPNECLYSNSSKNENNGNDLNNLTTNSTVNANELLSEDDEIAKELDEMFREDETEFDKIFNCDNVTTPDDPQMKSICNEMKQTKHVDISKINGNRSHSVTPQYNENIENELHQNNKTEKLNSEKLNNAGLSYSIWPCELLKQKRCLNQSLTRLLNEDLRWQDIISNKLENLFGQDSDDEFVTQSPSMDLNEVIIKSCVYRISRWVVKYLMKPLHHGLIGNRYLFKLLAKQIGRCIILQNQYPDEFYVKRSIEHFFCTRRAVMSIYDMSDIMEM